MKLIVKNFTECLKDNRFLREVESYKIILKGKLIEGLDNDICSSLLSDTIDDINRTVEKNFTNKEWDIVRRNMENLELSEWMNYILHDVDDVETYARNNARNRKMIIFVESLSVLFVPIWTDISKMYIYTIKDGESVPVTTIEKPFPEFKKVPSEKEIFFEIKKDPEHVVESEAKVRVLEGLEQINKCLKDIMDLLDDKKIKEDVVDNFEITHPMAAIICAMTSCSNDKKKSYIPLEARFRNDEVFMGVLENCLRKNKKKYTGGSLDVGFKMKTENLVETYKPKYGTFMYGYFDEKGIFHVLNTKL